MPLLSVLLPVKDGTRTLQLAVTSTLRAMPRDAELVVLDDGSSDHPEQVLDVIGDRRVRMLRNETSAGVGAGRRQLLEASDSRYVAAMDQDDVTLPGRFAHQLRILQHADLVVAPPIRFWDHPRRARPGLPLPVSAEAMPLHLLVHSFLNHPSLTATRAAVDTAGGYRSVTAEDYDLWMRALAAGQRLVRTARPVLAYRQHPSQTSFQSGFVMTARREPELREAYALMAERCFGVAPTWLDALWSGESGTPRMAAELAPLRSLIAERSHRLDPLQRWVLGRTVRLLDARDPGGVDAAAK